MWFSKKKTVVEIDENAQNIINIEENIHKTASIVFKTIVGDGNLCYNRTIEAILLSLNDRITVLENQVDALLEDSHY